MRLHAVVQSAAPEQSGFTPIMLFWLSVIVTGLAFAQTFLPDARGSAKKPEFLKHRIRELPTRDRQKLAEYLADQAEKDQQARRLIQSTSHTDPGL